MIVIYSPTGAEERRWDYKAEDLPSSEAEDVEDATGQTFDEFQVSLLKGGARARRALLWLFLKRDTPGLRFSDVAFRIGDLKVEFDSTEKQSLRAAIVKDKHMKESDRQQALELLADEEGEQAPKDPPTEDSGTSG